MKRAVAWFAENSVAANLLMVIILVAGIITISNVKKEIFPEMSLDMISIRVPYRGAAPEEVEEGVCVRIEEAIQGLEGIKKITSTASEGMGSVMVEVLPSHDTRELLDDVKSRVDAIETFPDETEKPVIREMIVRNQVINVAISGEADEITLKRLGEQVRDEITALPGITNVDLATARPYEISIEVSEEALRRHQLTFDDVARAVRNTSLDLPGGSVKTASGEILLRTKGQAYIGEEFARIVLLSRPDGTRLTVGDVATVVDGFAETDQRARFNGQPAVLVQVFRVGDQNAIEVADTVKQYVSQAQARMPQGISLTVWLDYSDFLRSRTELLVRNGYTGLLLLFTVLALFLKLRLAIWVSVGIPVSFLGAMALMPSLDLSVNMLSLFAFILVLGIVVDDAIVVGESIHTRHQAGESGLTGSIRGTYQVMVPVVFAVLTTLVAFSPLLFMPGFMGKFFRVIPLIVMPVLLFSLLESLFILPAHLSHLRSPGTARKPWVVSRGWDRFQGIFAGGLETFARKFYRRGLEVSLRWRYLTVAVGVTILTISLGTVGAGWLKLVFFPNVESDYVIADLTMPLGVPAEETERAARRIERAALQLKEQIDAESDGTLGSVFRQIFTSIGEQPMLAQQQRFEGNAAAASESHLAEVNIELAPSEQRTLSSEEIARRWRELTGPIPDAVDLTFNASIFSTGEAINIQFAGPRIEELQQVTEELKARLADYPGVYNVSDSFREGKEEIRLSIKPVAEQLGLTLSDLARQVRQGFYGEEAQRIQRGRDDVRIMVRYPATERRSLGDLESMRIRTPEGTEVPFSTVAVADYGRGYASINRVDRRRTINITADVDSSQANENEIMAEVTASVLPSILSNHPQITYSLEGTQNEQRESFQGLGKAFAFAVLAIYALLAIPFKSYVQPFIVLSAVPFGLVGAIWGHLIMGMDLSVLSLCGMVALTGVVVNDSLILVDYVNRNVRTGIPLFEAVRTAGVARFRPIILTSLTTFAGLTPLLLETSVQAQVLIPMAVSLGFGVLFATLITLLIVPCSYTILEDLKVLFARIFWGQPREEEELPASAVPSPEWSRVPSLTESIPD